MNAERTVIGDTELWCGDCRGVLEALPDDSVQCVVTSPPYYGLRDYGAVGQIGLEATLDEYIKEMVTVFRAIRRVLRSDGTLWLNLGDAYASGGGTGSQGSRGQRFDRRHIQEYLGVNRAHRESGLKPKDLLGIPWRIAFALQADGWYLRQDIIWHKPNPMPESVRDRCTKSHEYLFLLARSERYYFDAEAIKEPVSWGDHHRNIDSLSRSHVPGAPIHTGLHKRNGNKERKPSAERGCPIGANGKTKHDVAGSFPWEGACRNRRSVWTVTTKPFDGAHFATFPPALIEPCVLAGSRPGDVVLDPFAGSGTTLVVANGLGRKAIGIEINPDYVVSIATPRLREAQSQQRLFV